MSRLNFVVRPQDKTGFVAMANLETSSTIQLRKIIRRIAFWAIGWGFLIPGGIIATVVICEELVPVNHIPVMIFIVSMFALPTLTLLALISGWWMRKARWNTVRLGIALLTIDLYWYLFGKGITKFLFGGMG